MTPEVSALWSAGIAAAAGLLGAAAGALVTYFTMRQQTRVAIEAVKAQVEIARAERGNAFALAALEKRLEIHQKAYRLWQRAVLELEREQCSGCRASLPGVLV
jgi:hypothetical protein